MSEKEVAIKTVDLLKKFIEKLQKSSDDEFADFLMKCYCGVEDGLFLDIFYQDIFDVEDFELIDLPSYLSGVSIEMGGEKLDEVIEKYCGKELRELERERKKELKIARIHQDGDEDEYGNTYARERRERNVEERYAKYRKDLLGKTYQRNDDKIDKYFIIEQRDSVMEQLEEILEYINDEYLDD